MNILYFSRYLKKWGWGGGGGILDEKKSMFFVVTPCNFCSPIGSLWTQDLYCHPGTFAYNCSGLLEDDLGVQHPGKCRVAFVTIFSSS